MDFKKLKNLAAKNEVRIDDHVGHKRIPAHFYDSLRDAFRFYFNTFYCNQTSYDFYISSTTTNVKKNLDTLERQFLDQENTVLCLVSFERFFELFLKDILHKSNVKLTYTEYYKKKSADTWQIITKIQNKTFISNKPDKRVHKIPFREAIKRFYELLDYTIDPVKKKNSIVKRFEKAVANFRFFDSPDAKGALEFLNWYRDNILHDGNKLPRLRFLDFIVTQEIMPLALGILETEPSIPKDWLYFTQTISGIEIFKTMKEIGFELRNVKSNSKISETYNVLLLLGHLKELGRANMRMNNALRNNRSDYEYNYKDIFGRGQRFALAEKKNHPNAKEIKNCPCCTGNSLVHYVILGIDLPIPSEDNIEWLKCYTCDYYLRYNVFDLNYFNNQFEKHFGTWKPIGKK